MFAKICRVLVIILRFLEVKINTVIKVFFKYADKKLFIGNKQKIKNFVEFIFSLEMIPLKKAVYVFCSDIFLLDINRRFLHHYTLTDIITFDLSEKNNGITGEIYISLERVKENSLLFKTSFRDETLRVIFHGALHLCGYKDKTSSDKKTMRQKEDYYLKVFYDSHDLNKQS